MPIYEGMLNARDHFSDADVEKFELQVYGQMRLGVKVVDASQWPNSWNRQIQTKM